MRKYILQLTLLASFGHFACNKDFKSGATENLEEKIIPQVTSLSKVQGNGGDTISIQGTFSPTDNLFFGLFQISAIDRTDKEIRFVVPAGTGSAYVFVNSGGQQSNRLVFTYLIPPPREGYKVGAGFYDIDTTSFYSTGPGTEYMMLDFRDKDGKNPIRVHLTTVDVSNPHVGFKTVLAADSVLNVETVVAMANRKSVPGKNYFAGINGDLFNNTTGNANFGRITNSSVVDKVITNSNSAIQSYAPVYFNGNTIYFDDINFNTWVTMADGRSLSFRVFNSGRATDDLVMYNQYKGVHTGTNVSGSELGVVPVAGNWGDYINVPVKVLTKTTRASAKGSMIIPAGGAVISAHDIQDTLFIRQGNIGDILKVTAYVSNVNGVIAEQLISGDFRILNNGMAMNGDATRISRSAIGASKDKKKVTFCVVEGSIAGVSVGASRTELADILRIAGLDNAVNMNGGNFSTMFVKGTGFNNTGLMNKPGGNTTAPNAGNGLFAVSSAPTNPVVTKLVADLYSVRVKKNSSITPKFYGLNQYDHIVSSNLTGVSISGANEWGTISGTTFTAGEQTGKTELMASYNGLTYSISVTITD